jgi:hypothetical protein
MHADLRGSLPLKCPANETHISGHSVAVTPIAAGCGLGLAGGGRDTPGWYTNAVGISQGCLGCGRGGLTGEVDGLDCGEGSNVGEGVAVDDGEVGVVAGVEPSFAVAEAAGLCGQ